MFAINKLESNRFAARFGRNRAILKVGFIERASSGALGPTQAITKALERPILGHTSLCVGLLAVGCERKRLIASKKINSRPIGTQANVNKHTSVDQLLSKMKLFAKPLKELFEVVRYSPFFRAVSDMVMAEKRAHLNLNDVRKWHSFAVN